MITSQEKKVKCHLGTLALQGKIPVLRGSPSGGQPAYTSNERSNHRRPSCPFSQGVGTLLCEKACSPQQRGNRTGEHASRARDPSTPAMFEGIEIGPAARFDSNSF